MAEQIPGQTFAAVGIVGGNWVFAAAVDVEAAVFPGEQVGEAAGADVFAVAEGLQETVAEEFDHGGAAIGGHAVEATLEVKQAVGGKDVEMRMKEEIIAESVDGGDSGEAAIGEVETGAEGFEQGVGGGFEQEMEQVAALAEDAAQDFRDGENELAVWDFVTDGGGYPLGALADAALVAGGAEVAALAGEGEEAFVAAIRAVEAEETGGKIAAAEEIAHGGEDIGTERPHGGTVAFFIAGKEGIPSGSDDLPERRGTGAAGLVDGRHQ